MWKRDKSDRIGDRNASVAASHAGLLVPLVLLLPLPSYLAPPAHACRGPAVAEGADPVYNISYVLLADTLIWLLE